jgi:osmotically-inducible protein OsmY
MSILAFDKNLDSAIAQSAQRRLCASPYFFLRSLRCEVQAGVLTLCGSVPLGPLRQFAEVIVSRVEGVERVVNRIEVYDPQHAGVQRAKGA